MPKTLLFLVFYFSSKMLIGQQVSNCNNWLNTPTYGSAVNIGQLNVTGTQFTVEAEFYQTAYNTTQSTIGSADLVGKYIDPTNDNYLLRADYCSITTDQGFFQTPTVTGRQLNKNYQVAMVYDGDSLKYYQNGCEVSAIAASGNLIQNSFDARIGFYAYQFWDVQFYGYINEVRIWNVARSASQIRKYANSSLPNPTTQIGLLAYYTFDNLLNKQGNSSWNGTLAGAAQINQIDPSCAYSANQCNIPTTDSIIINDYTEVLGYDICKNELTVADATKYNPGDTVMIMQMKGAVIDSSNTPSFGNILSYNNAGNYEMNIVKSKNGNSLALLNVLQRQYDIPNGKVQLIRVPYYKDAVINNTLTCLPWDGSKGGVVVLNAQNSVTLNANIDVTGRGFSGGRSPNPNTTTLYCNNNNFFYSKGDLNAADKGESIASLSDAFAWGKGSPANGGGGGNGHNAGGGGGANGGMGGFGGYQLDACGGPATDNRGLGGKTLLYNTANNKIFMGGGGGSGHTDNAGGDPMWGGNGGGIVILISPTLTSNGNKIISRGGDGTECNLSPIALCHDGSGGGGGGGTILLDNTTIADATNVDVTGGKGGDLVIYSPPDGTKIGPGGGGGAGVVWLSNASIPANLSVTNTGGINGVILQEGNDPYGTTPGDPGINVFNLKIPIDTILFKKNIDSVRIKDSATSCSSFNFKAYAYTNGKSIATWRWTFGDGTTSAAQNPRHTYSSTGNFIAKLVVTDINGCSDSTTLSQIVTCVDSTQIINDYTEVLGFNICKNEITVADASKYNPGDTVLLIQMKGAIIDSSNTSNFGTITDYRSSGNYEYNYVKQKTGNVIQLKNLVTRTYDIPNGKVQLIRVPYYNNLTTNNTLTCLPWDGGKGGVLVFNVKDTLTMNLNMDVSGKGFRHGSPMGLTNITLNQQDYYYDYSSNDGGEKGEGIYSIGIDKNYGRGSPANAGGGGNAHNSGGGGGGNGGAGGEGGDQWETGDTLAENVGGKGGKALLTNAGLNKLFLGGSGGMGQANDLTEYPAGNGGGIIIFNAGFLNANGNSVYSNGDNATEAPNSNLCRDGMAGGGAGGSILANVGTIVSPLNIEAKGGKGADHIAMNVLHGPGGGGGGGVVAVNQSATPVQYTVDLSGGINGVNVYHNNDPHGALPGSTGIILNNFILPIDTIPFKPNIDSVRIKDTVTSCTSFDFKGFGYTNTAAINSWKWSFGDGNSDTQQNTSHNYASDGTYNVQLIVTDVNGCTDSISKPVTVSSLNIVKSKDTSICGPNPVQLSVSGGGSYSWTPASTLSNPNISNPVATPLVTTVYYVTATNAIFSCSKTDSIKITVNGFPTITKTADQNICINTSLQLFATGGTTYQWSPSSSLSNDAIANPVASPKTNTKYYVTVTNAQGCAKTDSVQIGIYPIANIIIGNDTSICSNASVQLFVSGGSSYLWSPASSLNNANSATPIATPASSTTYHVAIRDTYNCDYQDSVTVNVIPPAVFDVSPNSSVCSQKSAQLSASGGDTYTWSPAAGLNDPNIANPVASPATTTTYTVTIHANACNETGNLSTIVTVFSLPSVVASSANDLTCSFGSSQLTATGAASYIWSPSTGLNNPEIANPVASPPATTIYTVTGTDVNGCSNTDTAIVKVDFDKNALYLLPNSFTPNGDGINDCFGIRYWGFVQKLDFSIYNRFGEMVFHTADPNACWDGTYKGHLQEPAVFVYVIRATTICGEVDRKGTVTLLR